MKLGFLTACLPNRSLEQIAAWASENAFEALEVAAWPEDRLWGGTEDRIETGLRVAHRTLRPLLVA